MGIYLHALIEQSCSNGNDESLKEDFTYTRTRRSHFNVTALLEYIMYYKTLLTAQVT